MSAKQSPLQRARASYEPRHPRALRKGGITVQFGELTKPQADQDTIKGLFPNTYGQPMVTIIEGDGDMATRPLNVGVVLSGGQAPGGHNVIAGLFDALKAANSESRLFGFLKGPRGVIKGDYRELTAELIEPYRNTGGFDMIMSGRDKIETPEHLAACLEVFNKMKLDGLVVIGGDDSNTNAAVLAEYLRANGSQTGVIGVPKTIDGDMKNGRIEISFGFDTACKTYSELIGNICRDAMSAVKYWHFIRLMGRAASHVALECALQTHPNICLVSEEIEQENMTLEQVVDQVFDLVVRRSKAGKNYGILLVPEGLPEFIPEVKTLISELSDLLGEHEEYVRKLPDHSERVQFVIKNLSPNSARVYGSLPASDQAVLLKRDSHGNVPLSQVETERLLIDLVSDKVREYNSECAENGKKKIKFSSLSHFLGYEGRCAAPSNFDADYTYSLGYAAAQLVRAGLTGYTVSIQNLTQAPDEWVAGGVPVTSMLCMEMRKGEPTPVIRKALVDLNGEPFKHYAGLRDSLAVEDSFLFPGPIQCFGPSEVCDAPTVTLALESGCKVD